MPGINFLEQLKGAGALDIPDPMEAYGKAYQMRGMQQKYESGKLDKEAKVLTLGREYLKQVKGKDEYPEYKKYMTETLGMNPEVIPDSFEDETEFDYWKTRTLLSSKEYLDLKKGGTSKISYTLPNGQTVTTSEKFNEKEAKEFTKRLVDGGVDKENIHLGEVKGTPRKTKERLEMEQGVKNTGKPPKETPAEKLQRDKDLADYKETIRKNRKKDVKEYTKAQQMDDVRSYYGFLRSALIDPDTKGVISGKEEEYANLEQALKKDLKLVNDEKAPSFLAEDEERTVTRVGKYNGKKVVEYSDGTIEYAD